APTSVKFTLDVCPGATPHGVTVKKPPRSAPVVVTLSETELTPLLGTVPPGNPVIWTCSGVVGLTFCLATVRNVAGVPERVSNTRTGSTGEKSDGSASHPLTSTMTSTGTLEVKHTRPFVETGVITALATAP